MPKNFGKRVLRVRLYPDAESEIALAAEAAVLGLQASGIRAILDRVPRGFSPDAVNVTWTDDPEESRFVTLCAGDDRIARQLAEAFAYAFRGAREFIEMYERLNANLEAGRLAGAADMNRARPN